MKKTWNVSVEVGRTILAHRWDTEVLAETKEEAEELALAAYWSAVENHEPVEASVQDDEGCYEDWDEYMDAPFAMGWACDELLVDPYDSDTDTDPEPNEDWLMEVEGLR